MNQPANTVSSLGYLLVGVWLGFRLRTVRRSELAWAGAYAAMVGLNGFGSVAYHGPQFSGAEFMHDLPVVAALLIGFGVPVRRRLAHDNPLPGMTRTRAIAGAAAALVAILSYFLGRTGSLLCEPASVLQPHGLWHLATAVLMGIWGIVVWPGAGVAEEPGAPEQESTVRR